MVAQNESLIKDEDEDMEDETETPVTMRSCKHLSPQQVLRQRKDQLVASGFPDEVAQEIAAGDREAEDFFDDVLEPEIEEVPSENLSAQWPFEGARMPLGSFMQDQSCPQVFSGIWLTGCPAADELLGSLEEESQERKRPRRIRFRPLAEGLFSVGI